MEVHNKLESLHKYVPSYILPVEYGGIDLRFSDIIDDWNKKFVEYYEYFKEDKNYGVDLELKKKINKGK